MATRAVSDERPTARLNLLDELYLHLDREEEPWSVHLEIEVEGRLDDDRIREAVAAAADHHPIARAQMRTSRGTDVKYWWEIQDALDPLPVDVVDAGDEDEREATRQDLLNRVPVLDTPGPFAVCLVHHPDGDSLILNVHHAAGDGLGALRLMGSIVRAYAGEDDPTPDVDPLAVRDIRDLVGPTSVTDRIGRAVETIKYLARGVAKPTRVAPDDPTGQPGYGFATTTFTPEDVEKIGRHRRDGATINDILLGALGVTIRRWNDEHDASTGVTYLMMPVNLRPQEWRFDVVANYASYVSVRLDPDELADLPTAITAAAARTREIKNQNLAGLIVDLVEFPTVLPTGIKQRLQELIPLTGDFVVDTAVLSNLGKLQAVPSLGGEAGDVTAVWFSPPGRMPLGASMGVATLNDRLHVTLRYRHALLDAAAAERFGALFRAVLLDS
jgi:NRPS condensation-like uncharacterized protein